MRVYNILLKEKERALRAPSKREKYIYNIFILHYTRVRVRNS